MYDAVLPTDVSPPDYLSALKPLLTAQWPQNRTLTIVCHGHSVPAGYFKTPVVDTFNAYPHLLHVGLKQRFPFAVLNVIVTAIGGENAEAGARRFARDVLPLRPDVVTLDYALNDRRLGLERARAAWTAMIDQALAGEAKAKVVLLTPTPDMGGEGDLRAHADQVRALAKEKGVSLVDSLAVFDRRGDNGVVTRVRDRGESLSSLMSQSNHPNAKGHRLVADALLALFPSA